MNLRQPCTLIACLVATLPAIADVVTEAPRSYSVSYTLNDLQDPPVSPALTVTDSAILALTRVEVGLRLVGVTAGSGFASEMFVSLNKDLGTTSVLLNGVGITAGNGIGQGYDGWDVSFRDDAANGDVHAAELTAGTLHGAWQPDGRVTETDTDRPLMLSLFNGESGNGVWYLDLADLELGGQMRLESWSLTLTGDTAVPEASTWGAGASLLGLVVAGGWRRRTR